MLEVFVDTNDVLNGIYYQDEHMQDVYSKYPEILFIDVTHKLNDLRMPLYVLLVEDGNGESVIVAVSLVLHEDACSIRKIADLEIVQKMSYASSEDEYMQHYGLLKDTNLKSVLDYFNANWHSIRNQWVNGLKSDRLTLQNCTNNRLDCINQN